MPGFKAFDEDKISTTNEAGKSRKPFGDWFTNYEAIRLQYSIFFNFYVNK